MRRRFANNLMLGLLMVLTAVLARVMAPVAAHPGGRVQLNLESLIPSQFEGWKLDATIAGNIVNPEVRGGLERIYNQTLVRTYVNPEGDRIMLSIAYGGEQKTDMHAHRPEICYTAGGFRVSEITKTFIDTTIGRIPVMHLVARQGTRVEPITYWIRVGQTLTRGWVEQKLTAISYGVSGEIPDGVLVRVSSLSRDEQGAYRTQHGFLAAMLQAVSSEDRHWLVGRLGS